MHNYLCPKNGEQVTHVKQYRMLGTFFGPLYVGQWMAYGFDDTKTPLEREAYRVEENYNNEWARSGKYRGAPPPPLPGPFVYDSSLNEAENTINTNITASLDVNLVGEF